MTPDTKPCLAGCGALIIRDGIGPKHFAEKRYCSRACSVRHRKIRAGGDHKMPASEQSRERSRAAMGARWQVQHADTARYGKVLPPLPTREAEEAAIAAYLAERGATRIAAEAVPNATGAVGTVYDPMRYVRPMAGWRG